VVTAPSQALPAARRKPGPVAFLFTGSVLYAALIPMVPLDLFLVVYQAICFTTWGIPKVHRADHFRYDRVKLPYLTHQQRLHCLYCSYANGLASYFREILGRTEQYWCPIKHAHPLPTSHSRYVKFLANGDAEGFRKRGNAVAEDFSDLEN